MALRQQIDSLLLYDPNRARSTTNVWVAHPTPLEEDTLGKLFIVSLIDTPTRLNHEIISIIQEELKTNYYLTPEFKPERAFEQALQKTNQRLHQLIAEGVSQWMNHAHFLIGVVSRQTMVVSYAGRVQAYLLRNGKMHDMIGQTDGAKLNPLRVFSQLVTGKLEPADQLIFSTPTLFDYFSLEKLRRLMLEHPPHEAVRQIEQVLLGVDRAMAFAALIIRLELIEQRSAELNRQLTMVAPTVRTAPQVSMEELITRERTTEKLLTPSVWPALRDILQRTGLILQQGIRKFILRVPPKRPVPAGAVTSPTTSAPATHRSAPSWWPRLRFMVVASWHDLWQSMRRPRRPHVAVSPASMTASLRTLPQQPLGWLNRIVGWWQGRTRQQQSVLAAGVIVVLLLTSALVRSGMLGPNSAQHTTQTTTQAIDEHLQKAEAALLYQAEDTARQHWSAAEQLINSLPNKSKRDQSTRRPYEERLQAIAAKLAHRTVVEHPTLVTDVSSTTPAMHPTWLLPAKDQFILLDSQTGGAMATATTENSIATSLPPSTQGTISAATITSTGTVVTISKQNKMAELNPSTKTWKALTGNVAGHALRSLSTFQNRIYGLDVNNNDLVRLTRTNTGYSSPVSWLKEKADFHDAVQAVVDGSIFVLKNGKILEQYVAGRKTNFKLQEVTPTLTTATRFWTDADSRLYVLEPKQRRVLVYDKHGTFLDQYTSSRWSDLRDIFVREQKKQAVVLSGSTVQQFDLVR